MAGFTLYFAKTSTAKQRVAITKEAFESSLGITLNSTQVRKLTDCMTHARDALQMQANPERDPLMTCAYTGEIYYAMVDFASR